LKRSKKKRKTITDKTRLEASGCLQVIIEKTGNVNQFYDFQQILGEGSFGKVKKANVKASGAVRAVKAISKAAIKVNSRALEKEIRIGKIVDHPHIIKLYEIFEDDDTINLVMEICVHGNLEDLVLKRKQCSQQQTAGIMRQILSGVYYMHKSLICHRDLKPENVLVARQKPLTLKITDFGLSCFFTPGETMTSKVGTPAFMAPEVIRKRYTEMCDMWSCGVIMYFALCGYLPFGGETSAHVMKMLHMDIMLSKQLSGWM
jgi:calcium-dependent protein kinase